MTEEVLTSVEQKEATKEDREHIEIVEPYGFIYITTNLINGMRYLGQRKYYKRWRTYLGSGRLLNEAIKTYGKENFKKEIICFCYSADELNKAEYELSVFLNVVEDNNWYNLCYGGGAVSGWKMPDEQKKYISELKKNMSDEYRMKISIGTRKAMQDPELKKHLSEKAKERTAIPENCNMFGRHHTEESKAKISKARIGVYVGEKNPNYGNHKLARENNPRASQVIRLYDCRVYGCIIDSAEDNDVCRDVIRKRCVNRDGFMYYDEYLELLQTMGHNEIVEACQTYKPSHRASMVCGAANNRCGENNPNYGNHKLAGENNPMYGDHRWAGANNPRARQGVQLTKKGEFVQQWSYLKEGADSLGVDVNNIISCCAYRIPSAYGFKWMYLEEYEKYKHLPCDELVKLWKKQ